MELHIRQPYSFSQIGQRSNQEDARFPDSNAPTDCRTAFVICDGVGGEAKGEVASRTVADTIGKEVQHYDFSKPFTSKQFTTILENVYSALQKVSNSSNAGMATTMIFVCFHSKGIFTAYIGDSRIYHIRPNVGILYQSEDHSLVNALVHSGNLTPEEAINHPQSNIITRCLTPLNNNQRMEVATTYQISDVEAGDYIFMCTDGVLHKMDDSELVRILETGLSDKEKMSYIAELCSDSSDNNTAYLICIDDVVYDIDEVESGEDYINGSPSTTPLTIKNETVIETKMKKQKSISTQISDFFNKLF